MKFGLTQTVSIKNRLYRVTPIELEYGNGGTVHTVESFVAEAMFRAAHWRILKAGPTRDKVMEKFKRGEIEPSPFKHL